MGEVVNLRLARKARARSAAEDAATRNRAKFGTTKAERATAEAEKARSARKLDGVKRLLKKSIFER